MSAVFFSRLFIFCPVRECAPASLSDNGKLHPCQKSQLTESIQIEVTQPDREAAGGGII